MKNLKGKNAVITGAASGIGRAIAISLAKEGCNLAIADIDESGLNETAQMVKDLGVDASTHVVDVSKRDEVSMFSRNAANNHGNIDIVINNAGVSLLGNTQTLDYSDIEWIFGINLWGVIHNAKEFLPHLLKRQEAVLVNVSSVFGLVGVSAQSAYCATKFGVKGFSESLRRELSKTGVSVITVHPGGVRTNIVRNSKIKTKKSNTTFNKEQYFKKFEQHAPTTADEAARLIIKGIKKKSPRILIGRDARMVDIIQRFFPAGYDKILKNF